LREKKTTKDFTAFNSEKVERGKRGGWITITNNKKAQNSELRDNIKN